jgi:large subunit ribosomal protein L29
MPFLRIKEIRGMSSENRADKLDELKTELVRLRTMIGAGGTVDNPSRVKILRRAVAKIMTVEHEQTHGIRKVELKKANVKKTKAKKSESSNVKVEKNVKAEKKIKAENKKTENEDPEPKKRKKK